MMVTVKKYNPFHLKATVTPFLWTHWLMIIFIALRGDMADDSIQVKIHIKATLTTDTSGIWAKFNEVRISGMTIIWCTPKKAIKVTNRMINKNNILIDCVADHCMDFSKSCFTGV